MASSCEEEYSALYHPQILVNFSKIGIVDDEDNYVKFKIDRKDLGDFRKLDFSVTFDEAQRQLWVRTRKDNVLYQCNYLIKGLIKTSNLEGGLKASR
ncbi:hypothetical protein KP79_PYT20300 [Mizuhopecten yessoensis]|uniref:Uncharacterized protein n=1 Tax=Mizuhopecten yessoensis TaxID=6573 RepID=A0A210PRX6_MIZYE|nr:hypothetical protein KP79_PYT20300 [Mizuhopecten yessoensis]